MADTALNFPINPRLNVQEFNHMLQQMKTALGKFGKNIQLIDEASYKEQLKKFKSEAEQIPDALGSAAKKGKQAVKTNFAGMSGIVAKAFNFTAITSAISIAANSFSQLTQPFVKFEASLADLSAITGMSGSSLEEFGEKAKALSSQFGGTATSQIESFKGILSRLGPDIAKSPEALERMAISVNTLSKAAGLDATGSMEALTTALLQYNVSLDDPIEASKVMTEYLNVMAAGAQEGAAEIPQVKDALTVAGVSAYNAKISFTELNSAIQLMASGGKYGAEAGTALRNVIGLLQKASGPAEQAMAKMGTSSKELGEILTTKGLSAAIRKLKDGMNELGTDAEKNSAIMTIFGTENAAAAGVLIERVGQMDGLTAKITGTQTAFEQAKINMDTTQSAAERFQASVENMLIGTFQKLGSGLAGLASNISTVLPLIMALSAVKTIFPPGLSSGIGKLGSSLIMKLLPALAGTTLSLGSVAAAAWAALAPLLPFIAIAGALAVGIYALSGGFDKSTESKIKDAEASEKLINKQIEQTEASKKQALATIELADAWERLGRIDAKTPEELEQYNDLTVELTKRLPGAIDANKSFEDNLASVKDQLIKTNKEVKEFDKTVEKLRQQKEVAVALRLQLETQKAGEDMQATIEDALQDSMAGGIFSSREIYAFDEGEMLKELVSGVENAANSEELTKASQLLYAKISESTTLTDADKVILYDQTAQLMENRTKAFEQQDKAMEAKHQNTLNKIRDEVNKLQEDGVFNIDVNASEDDIKRFETAVQGIAGKYKVSKEEALKFLDAQKKNTEEAGNTAAAAGEIPASYSDAAKAALDERNKGIAREKDLVLTRNKALAEGNRKKAEELLIEINKQHIINKNLDAESDKLIKLGKDIEKSYEENKKTSTRRSESFYQRTMKQIKLDEKALDLDEQKTINLIELTALSEKRNLTDIDNMNISQAKLDNLEAQKKKLIETFGITEGKDGNITFDPKISKKLSKEDKLNVETAITNLNKQLINEEKNTLEIKPVLDKIDKSEIIKSDLERLKLEIELGFTVPGGTLPLMEQYLTALSEEKAEIEKKLRETTDEAERRALEESLHDKTMDELNAMKDIRDMKQKELEKQLKDVEEANQEEINMLTKKLDAKKVLESMVIDAGEASAGRKESERYADEMKKMEKLKTDGIVSEEYFNKQKELAEAKHQSRMASLQAAANGAKLAAERNFAIELLEIKRENAASALAIASAGSDQELIKQKTAELDAIKKEIEDKGTMFDALGEQMKGGITNIFAGLMAGDNEAMKEAAKTTFATMAGILKKEASLAITKLIINYLWQPDAIPWYAKLAAIPAITALVSGAVNTLVDPIINSVSSFATGGRIDEPTLILAGDASRARPGADTEWVMRDDQIKYLVVEALHQSTLSNITISELYRKHNETFILDALDEYTKDITTQLSVAIPKVNLPEGYSPNMGSNVLHNPVIQEIVQENTPNTDTRKMESLLENLITTIDNFEGRIHIVESEVADAAVRQSNRQTKRTITL